MRLSSNVERLQPSATMAVASLAKRLKAEGRDVVDFSAGEPDFDTPSFISEAAIDGIHRGMTRYTPAQGLPELRKAIAKSLSARAGRELDWNGVVVSAGAKQSLFNACFTLFGPGDEVLVAAPYWTSYPDLVHLARADSVTVAGPEERDFQLTPDDLERAATPRTRGLIYSSPSNPTGSLYSKAELQAIAEWARDRDIVLIADEIYREICFDGDGPAAGLMDLPASSLGPYVLIDGASKSFAMTGWRIGFSYCDPKLATEFASLQSQTTSNPATPSQVAALEAYKDPRRTAPVVAEMVAAFRRRRDLVVRLFDELLPDFPYVTPRGAFYLFFRVDSAFDDQIKGSSDFCKLLLEETGVAVVPGGAFGDDRYVRMSYATSDAIIEDGIRRMAGMLARK